MPEPQRKQVGGFTYSRGSYPVQDFHQDQGYAVTYLQDGTGTLGRYEFEISVTVERLIPIIKRLSALLPDEVYLILESYPMNSNARRVYLTDSKVTRGDFLDLLGDWEQLWKDEGFVAFGAFSYDPAIEIFVNEHKTVMIYTPWAETAEEILASSGLPKLGVLEPYYMNVEHIHTSMTGDDGDGETYLLRERMESHLFEQFDFYDQTPVFDDEDDISGFWERARPWDGEPHVEEPVAEDGEMISWRCHVQGRLVVAPEGRPRDFEQIFCVTAPDEQLATTWVREVLRETNARVVRVREFAPLDASDIDPLMRPEVLTAEEGIWYESERIFRGEVC